MGIFVREGKWETVTYSACLPHDLAYAYGEPGNEKERAEIDNKFYQEIKKHLPWWASFVFRFAVQIGGYEKFKQSFSWGFAWKNKEKLNEKI